MKMNLTLFLLFFTTFSLLAQSRSGIIPIDDDRLFKVLLEINENNVLSRSNEYFRMQAVKVASDERASDDEDIQAFKSFYYIVIADFEESPQGKLYQTKNLISPQISVFPDSYRFFKILITHGKRQEKQLVLFASNEKLYVKKE
ncbi:hypothetical protein U8527_06065 [Kordia algicida OT-1]|uniref:Uncharacterized protein n=1 Tax=Kordia algicida OT-1 TaxID=391587 RepID=A9E171_9FLAO|nr:hypothetical protein [Kordia algicida]EDP95590.1 hypothetical protein KAOT1_22101 [Kordia algicida OT-1]